MTRLLPPFRSDTVIVTTTDEQRAAALDVANKVRLDRAKFRMRVEAGEIAAWKTIEDPPAFVLTTTIFDYITWLPNIGKSRGSVAFKLLRKARVESHLRIGELTPGQRERLSAAIHDFAYPTGRSRSRELKSPMRRAMRGEGTHPAEKGWT